MLSKKSKIFIAGHKGMVGSSIKKKLLKYGYKNLILVDKKKLDLLDQKKVHNFLKKKRPRLVIISAARVGGILAKPMVQLGHLVTRVSGGAIGVIMIFALLIAHSDWGIFFGERGSVLFASEQLFLLLLGTFYAIRGNN